MSDKHINKKLFLKDLKWVLRPCVGSNYADCIASDEDFFNDVIRDVEETSAWEDEGCYNEDDVRLAVGRVLIERLNIAYY